MKTYTVLLLVFFSFISLNAQDYFNKLYSYPDTITSFETVIVENDTILCYGDAVVVDPDRTTRQGVLFVQMDSFGNELNRNIVFDTLGESLVADEEWGNVIIRKNGGYVALVAPKSRSSHILISLRDDLSIEFIREYRDTVNPRNYYYTITESLHGYIICGNVQQQDNDFQTVIRYVDYQGEIIWEYKSNEKVSWIPDMAKINDSVFIAGVYNRNGNNEVFYSLVEFDLQKNFKTKWTSKNRPKEFIFQEIIPTSDGGFLLHGSEETGRLFNSKLYQTVFLKLNSNFEEEWKNFLGKQTNSIFTTPRFYSFIEKGAHIFCLGTDDSQAPLPTWLGSGVLYKLDLIDGDSVFRRSYHPPFPLGTTGNGNFYGMGQLSSGNLILGGEAIAGGSYFGWIVKTNQEGSQATSNISDLVERQESIITFPNPNSGIFFFEKTDKSQMNGILKLTDSTGKLVFSKEIKNQMAGEIDLPSLPKGIYFLKLQEAEKVFLQKVQIEKK